MFEPFFTIGISLVVCVVEMTTIVLVVSSYKDETISLLLTTSKSSTMSLSLSYFYCKSKRNNFAGIASRVALLIHFLKVVVNSASGASSERLSFIFCCRTCH